MRIAIASIGVVVAASASAFNVYIVSSGNTSYDASVQTLLSNHGMTSTVGANPGTLTTSTNLSGFHTVLLLWNYNWATAMTTSAANALVNSVQAGRGLVTVEWTAYNNNSTLNTILPGTYQNTWRGATSVTYTRVTADPVIDAGLPASFSFDPGNVSGSESYIRAKSGATTFYRSNYHADAIGVVAWNAHGGRVAQMSTVMGAPAITGDSGRLLANTVQYSAVPEPATLAGLGLGLVGLMRRRSRA